VNALPGVLSGTFPRFALLAAALYGAFGLESPFLPAFMAERGLSPTAVGLVLAAGTLVRLVAGPLAGRLADRRDAARGVAGAAALAAGAISFAYLGAWGVLPVLAVGLVHAAAIAPLAPLTDALALAGARAGGFAYGWVRGVGSGAFVLGTLAAGGIVAGFGLAGIIVASGIVFLGMAVASRLVPAPRPGAAAIDEGSSLAAVRTLAREPALRAVAVLAALVIGSHAVHDAFAVIRWRAAGLSEGTVSVLWSAAVLAEVAVFLALGPPLLARFGPARCAALAALAGAVRWTAMALTVAVPVLALAQLLHGLTFALLHLAAMQVIARTAPPTLAATAQTLYGTACLGLASAALTALSGPLYGRFGPGAFWAMAALCLAALPFAAALGRQSVGRREGAAG
jgi:MFS transporter, PPP family, 3-phenylpropionic acid transporter